jgi:polar amino acid transport system permease protein
MAASFDFGVVLRDPSWILLGLWGTFKLCLISLTVALPLGLPIALLRMSAFRPLAVAMTLYLDLMRTVPTIVLLFWVYFALPLLVNVNFGPLGAAALTLILQYSAFFAEIFRGGIASLERGQWEAAKALGMTFPQQLRKVILPQAIRRMVPPFFHHVIDLIKTTSIASTIAFAELVFEGSRTAADTYRPIEAFTIVGAIYFVILFGMSIGVGRIEARLKLADR